MFLLTDGSDTQAGGVIPSSPANGMGEGNEFSFFLQYLQYKHRIELNEWLK